MSSLVPWSAGDRPTSSSVPVTVIVLTLNEASNIERCLKSLGWADQVVVVDSGSTDGTSDLARALGADVLFHEFEDFGSQRNWALQYETIRNDWVFFVDADEWVPALLAEEIEQTVAKPRHSGYALRFRLIWQGRWIRHAGWYSGSWVVRLFRKEGAFVRGSASERVSFRGTLGRLKSDIVDEDLKPFSRWLEKHNRYSSLRARQVVEMRETSIRFRLRQALSTVPRMRIPRELIKLLVLPHLPAVPLFLFLYLYVVRGGFLDGRQGLWFCSLHAAQEATVRVKVAELERTRSTKGRGA